MLFKVHHLRDHLGRYNRNDLEFDLKFRRAGSEVLLNRISLLVFENLVWAKNVLHVSFEPVGDFDLDVDLDEGGLDALMKALGEVFTRTNNGLEHEWSENGCRSTSVGDLIEVIAAVGDLKRSILYVVNTVGFTAIARGENDKWEFQE